MTFINSEGMAEQGVDGGGLFKEFMTQLTQKIFNPAFGFFVETEDRTFYPNPLAS